MGEIFKRNWKKLTGVRVPLTLRQEDVLRLIDQGLLTTNASGIAGIPVDTSSIPSGTVLIFDGTQWVAGTTDVIFGNDVIVSGILVVATPPLLTTAQNTNAAINEIFSIAISGIVLPSGALGPAGGDLSGTYPTPTVSGIQNAEVAPTTPLDGQGLVFDGSRYVPSGLAPTVAAPVGPAAGDLTGAYPSPTVSGIRGQEVAVTTPLDGQALVHDGTRYVPSGLAPGAAPPIGPAAGDLTGTYPAPTVSGIQNVEVATTTPLDGFVLIHDGTRYVPSGVILGGGAPAGPAGGDLSGSYPNPTVSGIQNVEVSATTPLDGHILIHDGTRYVPSGLVLGGDGPPVEPGGQVSTVVISASGTDIGNFQQFVALSGTPEVNLPGFPLNGQFHYLKDVQGNAESSNILVNGSGINIDGLPSFTIQNNFESISVLYVSALSEWFLF